jgi:parallel beta-helix repeat protein
MMTCRHYQIVFLVSALVLGILEMDVQATTYHVDVARGNDSFPGSDSQPFKTITRASQIMRSGDTALIHEGVYHEQIMGGRSGVQGAPITYEGVDESKVILQGSVRVKDWLKASQVWVKTGLNPITDGNAFVMVDERTVLTRVASSAAMPPGSFYLGTDGSYTIRLQDDANPNLDHDVDVYELDLGFNSGNRWGGTAKKWIVLRNMTLEKYGVFAISTDARYPADNSWWEMDRVTVRYNNAEGVFYALDDWFIHDCTFTRNRGHGCQINGARTRFLNNLSSENEWFGPYSDAGCGLLIGPDASANSCIVKENIFENNGDPNGYGCGIYLEGRAHDNLVENNLVKGGTSGGIAFYGASQNKVINNILVNIASGSDWDMAAAFVLGHSYEGEPTQSVGNLIAHNTVYGCASPLAILDPTRDIASYELNRIVNNLFAGCGFRSLPPLKPVAVTESSGCFSCPQNQGSGSTNLENVPSCDTSKGDLLGNDPGLRDPLAGDFRLRFDSPLKAAGTPVSEVTTDRAGNLRPTNGRPAIGAYEYMLVEPSGLHIEKGL